MMPMRKYDGWEQDRYYGKTDLRTLGGRETVLVSTPYPFSVGAFTKPAAPEWLAEAKRKITQYTSLSHGWDGYRGIAVDKTTADYAVQVMSNVVTTATPRASVLPLSGGGLQFEWHREGKDLEITFYSPLNIGVSFSRKDAEDIELIVSDDVSHLKLFLEEVAQ